MNAEAEDRTFPISPEQASLIADLQRESIRAQERLSLALGVIVAGFGFGNVNVDVDTAACTIRVTEDE